MEHPALDHETMLAARMKRAQAADRIAARQDHDLDALFVRVQREQLADQTEDAAGFRERAQTRALQRFILREIACLEEMVLFLEIEKRAR